MMKSTVLLKMLFGSLALLLLSCGDEDPVPVTFSPYVFMDGFEAAGPELGDLFPDDGSRWSNLQLVHPDAGFNAIEIDTQRESEGQQSLHIVAMPSGNVLSKADIEKSGFSAGRNAKVTIRADFFLAEEGSFANAFLIDLECCSCWDPSVSDNQCPGVRLKLDESGQYLHIERGKIGLNTLTQFDHPLPRGEWVVIEWEMLLSDTEEGSNMLRTSATGPEEIISVNGINMPNQAIFDSLAAAQNITFQLQQPISYERFQIGLTANPSSDTASIWVDNVFFEVIR